jgi:hypothetical protein
VKERNVLLLFVLVVLAPFTGSPAAAQEEDATVRLHF